MEIGVLWLLRDGGKNPLGGFGGYFVWKFSSHSFSENNYFYPKFWKKRKNTVSGNSTCWH